MNHEENSRMVSTKTGTTEVGSRVLPDEKKHNRMQMSELRQIIKPISGTRTRLKHNNAPLHSYSQTLQQVRDPCAPTLTLQTVSTPSPEEPLRKACGSLNPILIIMRTAEKIKAIRSSKKKYGRKQSK